MLFSVALASKDTRPCCNRNISRSCVNLCIKYRKYVFEVDVYSSLIAKM